MDIEYLQTLWQKDEGFTGYRLDGKALQKLVQDESRKFERHMRWRDWYELIGGVVIGSFFLLAAVFQLPGEEAASWTDHWDRLLLAAGCFFISFIFVRLRLAARAFVERAGDSLVETLEKRRDGLEQRIRAIRGIIWWYLAPVAVPLGVMVAVSFPPDTRIRFIVLCLVSFVAIVGLNRWYANRRLQPKLDSVNRLIEEAG